jgi:hydrogenase maturation protease
VSGRTVVAGIGNVFRRDDAFGVEVVRRLAAGGVPVEGVEVVDVGLRGVHLAYDLLDGCDLLVVIDVAPLGRPPGTVHVIEVDAAAVSAAGPATVVADAHRMTPETVIAFVHALGGRLGRVVVVACEPQELGEGVGLSDPVATAVDPAVRAVRHIVQGHRAIPARTAGAP